MAFNTGTFGQRVPYWAGSEAQKSVERNQTKPGRSVYFKDTSGRSTKIGGKEGVRVYDANGETIHDVPDCVIASDMAYAGHLIFLDGGATHIALESEGYTNTDTSYTNDTLINTDLSPYLPSDITNARGVLLGVSVDGYILGSKCKSGTEVLFRIKYSTTYNVAPSTANVMIRLKYKHTASDADNAKAEFSHMNQACAPIVYNNDTPYLTWKTEASFGDMTAVNATYNASLSLYLLGFFA